MNKLAMFVPLAKADAAQRLVYGYIDETPDRAGEVMDYVSSKPHFEAWSDTFAKATDGRSVGNLRAQHGKTAAGLFEKISYDDENKRIELCARIIDDNEWEKVEAGVYTGFSPGGRYAKRWQDGAHRRYTAIPSEVSIVDLPCIPTATFTMIKADGVEAEVEFVLDKAYEPGNEATKARAEEMAKAANGSWKDYVAQARADLISENVTEALAKMAGDEIDEVTGDESASAPAGDTPAEPGLLDKFDAALAKADIVLVPNEGEQLGSATAAYAAALTGTLMKCDVELAVAPPSPEAVALIGADLSASIAAVEAIRAAAEPKLEKGLYELSSAVNSLQSFAWLTQDVTWEAGWEGDNSQLPQMAVNILQALKAFLIAMVEEEVAEMLSRLKADADESDVSLVVDAEAETMELATQIIDLVKADEARMAKAGARNSRADAARIQAIHDKAHELGAACASDDETLGKSASLASENERLTKAVTEALPRLEALTAEIDTMRNERAADREEMVKMQAEIERLGGQPAPTKIEQVLTRDKAADNGTLEKSDDASGKDSLEAASKLTGRARSQMLERIAINARHQIPA